MKEFIRNLKRLIRGNTTDQKLWLGILIGAAVIIALILVF